MEHKDHHEMQAATEEDAMDVVTNSDSVVSRVKSRLSIEKAERSAKEERRESALMKKRKKRRNVRFHADVKEHDGLTPIHRTLDALVYAFFQSKISSTTDILNLIPVTDLHLLSACYVKLNEVMKRCKAYPERQAYILPGGGGRGSSCLFKTHYPFLRRLREIIRVTHNLLHDAAAMADKKGLKEKEASDFVLNHVRKVDEVNRTLDSLFCMFFQSKIRSSSDILKLIPVKDLHLLSACYVKLNEKMKRYKTNPEKVVDILPQGVGQGSSCFFETHYTSLRRLREIIRVTHNLLHDASIMADKKGLKDRAASDFVLDHVRKVDEESRRVVSSPAPSSSASASSSSSFASTTTTAGSPKRSSNGLAVLWW